MTDKPTKKAAADNTDVADDRGTGYTNSLADAQVAGIDPSAGKGLSEFGNASGDEMGAIVTVAPPKDRSYMDDAVAKSELSAKERNGLSDSDFAYIDAKGGRHLPIGDANHVRDALARFNQTHFESAEAKSKAKAKIDSAAKRLGVNVTKSANDPDNDGDNDTSETGDTDQDSAGKQKPATPATPAKPAAKPSSKVQKDYDGQSSDDEESNASTSESFKEDIQFTETVQVLEAADRDKTGSTWDVVAIKSGMSKNGNNYPAHTLESAVRQGLFEGVRVFADHPGRAEQHDRPERSIRDIVGWMSNARYAPDSQEVKAKFHVLESADWLRKGMLSAYNSGKPDLYGFSIRADARVTTEKSAGRMVRNVEALVRVPSVDVVTDPSAGGRVVQVLASNRIDPIEEEVSETHMTDKPAAELTALQEVKAEAERLLMEARQERFSSTLDRKLAESKLPEKACDRIRSVFSTQIGSEAQINEAIVAERDYLADVAGFGVKDHGTQRTSATITHDQADKIRDAMYGMIDQSDINGVPRFRGLREAYCKVKGIADWDIRPDVWLKETWQGTQSFGQDGGTTQVQEALTSTSWSAIFGDSITRKLLKEYQLPGFDEWRKVCSEVTSAKDFRTMRRERVGGYSLLPTVAQTGAYAAQTSPGPDQEATYAVAKRGGTEILTLESLVNDDLGAIRRIPTKLGRAAAMTLYHFIFDFLKDNSTNVSWQANTLYSFGNTSSTPLDSAGLTSAKVRMASQVGFGYPNTGTLNGTTNPLGGATFNDALLTRAKYLIVPIHLEPTAKVLMMSDRLPGTLDNDINIHKGTLEPITVQYWTSATAAPGSGVDTNTIGNSWFLMADPSLIPTIEVSFLGGKEEPELFTQDMQNVGVMFDSDQIKYKIRHIYGGTVLDWRGFDASFVA